MSHGLRGGVQLPPFVSAMVKKSIVGDKTARPTRTKRAGQKPREFSPNSTANRRKFGVVQKTRFLRKKAHPAVGKGRVSCQLVKDAHAKGYGTHRAGSREEIAIERHSRQPLKDFFEEEKQRPKRRVPVTASTHSANFSCRKEAQVDHRWQHRLKREHPTSTERTLRIRCGSRFFVWRLALRVQFYSCCWPVVPRTARTSTFMSPGSTFSLTAGTC